MPIKRRYDRSLYLSVQQSLYPNFGRIAGMGEFLALVTTSGLAWWVRKRRPAAYPLTVAAAAGLAAAHATFWFWISPVNAEIAKWRIDTMPPNWMRWRDQWEYSHAVRAFLITGSLAASVLAVLKETPEAVSQY
jgi:hypothetical protein